MATQLETSLIANREKMQLSALGYKQLNRIIEKACRANGTHRYASESKPLVQQVEKLVTDLIFNKNLNEDELSKLQKSIKVVNKTLQLPSIATA